MRDQGCICPQKKKGETTSYSLPNRTNSNEHFFLHLIVSLDLLVKLYLNLNERNKKPEGDSVPCTLSLKSPKRFLASVAKPERITNVNLVHLYRECVYI